MSRPKTAQAYPTYMIDILDQMTAKPDMELEMFFPTPASAASFRLDFYAFRKSALEEGMDKIYPDLKVLSVRVSKDGKATVFHKDHTKTAQIVADALELAKQKALQQSAGGKPAN